MMALRRKGPKRQCNRPPEGVDENSRTSSKRRSANFLDEFNPVKGMILDKAAPDDSNIPHHLFSRLVR
jgi:hypothetical protein